MSSHVWLDFIPKSQKNKLTRVTLKTREGPKSVLSYRPGLPEQRTKIMWLLKALDRAPDGYRFAVEVEFHAKEKKTKITLVPVPVPVGIEKGLSDPDGALVTLMDCLKLSGRIADDSINHVAGLKVSVL